MNQREFDKLQALFYQAYSLTPEQRDQLLDEHCRDRPELRARVVRYLEVVEPAAAGPEGDAAAPATTAGDGQSAMRLQWRRDDQDPGELFTPGTKVGCYELVRWVGRGGMGQVWEARSGAGMRVAIKLVFREAYRDGDGSDDGAEIAHEFHQLKTMRHNHIVRVHDAGVHVIRGRSVPFLVMEYLPGARSITAYAVEARSSVRERLELFASVCEAVAHLHGAGRVHLDLKPDNMLVDADGHVFLTDFGIARPVHGWFIERVGGTPGFMSLEHLMGDVDRIDKRADVWALGAVLFWLVAGRDPHGLERSASPMARVECGRKPADRLRDVVPDLADRAPELAAPLEEILGKSLAPDRDARFVDAGELLRAVRSALHPGGLRELVQVTERQRPRLWTAIVLGMVVLFSSLVGKYVTDPVLALMGYPLGWYSSLMPATSESLAAATELSHVTIVGFDTATAERVAAEHLPGFVPETSRASYRPMHAAAIERLVAAKVRVIVLDLHFPSVQPDDRKFGDAIRAAQEAGVPVVVGNGTWQLDEGRPLLSPAIAAGGPGWGGLEVLDNEDGSRGIPLLLRRATEDPMPSLGMAVLAAYESRRTTHEFDSHGLVVTARTYTSVDGKHRRFPARFQPIEVLATDRALFEGSIDNRTLLEVGDLQHFLRLDMPSEEVLQRSTIEYADLWGDPILVGQRLRGRVALVADVERDPVGHRVQAVGIESLIQRFGTVVATRWNDGLIALGAVIGASFVLWRRRARRARRSRAAPRSFACVAVVAGATLASVVLFAIAWTTRAVEGTWLHPFPGFVAAILAAGLALRWPRVVVFKEPQT